MALNITLKDTQGISKTYRPPTSQVAAPVVAPTKPLSTTSTGSKTVTQQIAGQNSMPAYNSSEWLGTPKLKSNALTPPPLGAQQPIAPVTQAGQVGGTIVDPKMKYFDDVSKSIGYTDYADYQKQTGQTLDSISGMYDSNKAMTGDTKFAEQRGAEIATALQNFTYAKNQSEARMLAMGTDIINGPDILKEQEKIGGLINKGIIDPMQIGSILGMDAKKVTDLINGKIEPYVTLSEEAYNNSNADNIQRNIDYQNQKYENDKAQGFEQLRRLEEDYTKQSREQNTQNKIADGNLSILARMTGVGFSNRGIMGMDEVMRQGQRILAEMSTQYERSSEDTRNYLGQLAKAYTYNNTELIDSLNQSIDATKQGYFTAIQSIRTQFGDATVETEKQVKQSMINFANDINKYYEDVNAQMKTNFDMAQTNYQNAVQNEQITYQRQQDSINQYKEASFTMTATQIMNDVSLTPQQKQVVIAQQQQSAVNYLSQLSASGVARPEDVERMKTLLANPNVTPQMAIAQIVKDNPTLYGTQAKDRKDPTIQTVIDPVTGEQKSMYWDENGNLVDVPATPQQLTPSGTLTGKDVSNIILSGNVSALAASMQEGVEYSCGTRGQCGEWYNDAVGIKNGTRVGNLYTDKTKFVDASITQGEAGMGVVFQPQGGSEQYGHIGVLASGVYMKDGVAGYDVISANMHGNEKLTKDFVSESDIANTGGGFIPTVAKEEGQATTTYSAEIMTTAQNIVDGIGGYPSKTDKDYRKVQDAVSQIIDTKAQTTDDKQLSTIYQSAKYDKEIAETTAIKLTDAFTVLSSVSNLTTQLENMEEDVGPIEGYLRGKNPYDVDAQAIAAQLNALVPKVARGVFGEVGVLTDQDVARYMKTLPNSKMPKDLAVVIGDLLKITVTKSLINSIVVQAKGQRNVSSFAGDYEIAKEYLMSKGLSADPWASYDEEATTETGAVKISGVEIDDAYIKSLLQAKPQ